MIITKLYNISRYSYYRITIWADFNNFLFLYIITIVVIYI